MREKLGNIGSGFCSVSDSYVLSVLSPQDQWSIASAQDLLNMTSRLKHMDQTLDAVSSARILAAEGASVTDCPTQDL